MRAPRQGAPAEGRGPLHSRFLISNPFKEGFFGDLPNPGRGLAALCTPADFYHSSAEFDMSGYRAAAPGPCRQKPVYRVPYIVSRIGRKRLRRRKSIYKG